MSKTVQLYRPGQPQQIPSQVGMLAEAGQAHLDPQALRGAGEGLMVTPRDIDARVTDLAKVVGFGINLALQTGLTVEDVELFLS